MLPFIKKNQEASASAPVESIERKPDETTEETEYDDLEGAMEELFQALTSKNYKDAAEIFRGAFELLEKQPHEDQEST